MTVVSFKQDSFRVHTKRSNQTRSFDFSPENSVFAWISFTILAVTCLLSVFYCTWVTRSAALQFDIQKIEKTLLGLEEKNADLKTQLANAKSSGQLPEAITSQYSKELWPKYFSINKEQQVVAVKTLSAKADEF